MNIEEDIHEAKEILEAVSKRLIDPKTGQYYSVLWALEVAKNVALTRKIESLEELNDRFIDYLKTRYAEPGRTHYDNFKEFNSEFLNDHDWDVEEFQEGAMRAKNVD